jgi:hypothetical protein
MKYEMHDTCRIVCPPSVSLKLKKSLQQLANDMIKQPRFMLELNAMRQARDTASKGAKEADDLSTMHGEISTIGDSTLVGRTALANLLELGRQHTSHVTHPTTFSFLTNANDNATDAVDAGEDLSASDASTLYETSSVMGQTALKQLLRMGKTAKKPRAKATPRKRKAPVNPRLAGTTGNSAGKATGKKKKAVPSSSSSSSSESVEDDDGEDSSDDSSDDDTVCTVAGQLALADLLNIGRPS